MKNFRDFGLDNVRKGVFFRGEAISKLSNKDKALLFKENNIKVVIDLRSIQEKESKQGEEAANLISQLAFEKNYVPFNLKQLEDCLKTITEEKAHISANRSTKMALTGNDMKKDGELLLEYAKRKGRSWPSKKKGESSS